LWLAVIITPPAAFRCLTAKETDGVGKNFGNATAKFIGQKTAVVTSDNGPGRADDRLALPKIRRGLRDAIEVAEGKILRDHRAPAVCAELDIH
jgi:hypothetical protein